MALDFTLVSYPGHVLAWCDSWPGLFCGGPDRESLEAGLPLAVAEYSAWLTSAGLESPGESVWRIAAELDASAAPGGDVCSAADRLPIAPQEMERLLSLAALAASDLAAAADLPPALLDWVPAGLQLARADPWAPDIRTVRGIVTHALQLEAFYRGSLTDGPAEGIFGRVATVHEETARTAEVLRAADTDRVFRPSHAGGPPEEWTVRKVLRRLISHHRQHTAEILQRRTWVLLGVPEKT